MSKETLEHNLKHPKEPGSAITHFIGVVMILLAALPTPDKHKQQHAGSAMQGNQADWGIRAGNQHINHHTIGGIIYALKLPVFNKLHRNFGSHEIFHLFCLGGSLCHFVLMYLFVVEMPKRMWMLSKESQTILLIAVIMKVLIY